MKLFRTSRTFNWLCLCVLLIVVLDSCKAEPVCINEIQGGNQFCVISESNEDNQWIPNDDFCDDWPAGSDEALTSACSNVRNKQTFTCMGKHGRNVSLSFSKVQDGICDCCDGSDEIGSFFPTVCPNQCEELLVVARQQALLDYRNLQSGLRKRSEILTAHQRTHQRARAKVSSLLAERQQILGRLLDMRMLLGTFEIPKESAVHWKLLRQRSYTCASGYEETCKQLFSPSFLSDEELMDEGLPAHFLNPKKRYVHEYTQEEKRALETTHGMQRLDVVICPRQSVLPDDDARFFTRLGEYLTYLASPGGKVWLRERHRKNSDGANSVASTSGGRRRPGVSIFSRFLDHGHEGHVLAAQVALEGIGLLFTPVIYANRQIWAMCSIGWIRMWSHIEAQADLATTRDRGLIPSGQWWEEYIDRVATFLVDLVQDDSPIMTTWNQVESIFEHSSAPLQLLLGRYIDTPLWALETALRAPDMYYHYYLEDGRLELPPRRHACLLREGLRIGEEELAKVDSKIASEEKILSAILSQADRNIPSRSSPKELKRQYDRNLSSKQEAMKHANKIRQLRVSHGWNMFIDPLWWMQILWEQISKSDALSHWIMNSELRDFISPPSLRIRNPLTRFSVDEGYQSYGIDDSWSAVVNECTELKTLEYTYSICLFGEIRQNNNLLGSFSHWGNWIPRDLLHGTESTNGIDLSGRLTESGDPELEHLATQLLIRKLRDADLDTRQKLAHENQKVISQKRSWRDGIQQLVGLLPSMRNFIYRLPLLRDQLVAYFVDIASDLQNLDSDGIVMAIRIYAAKVAAIEGSEGEQSFVSSTVAPILEWVADIIESSVAPYVNQHFGLSKKKFISRADKDRLLEHALQKHFSVQVYDLGDPCDQNLHRWTRVEFLCGVDFTLESVQEKERCVYDMVVRTPMACTPKPAPHI